MSFKKYLRKNVARLLYLTGMTHPKQCSQGCFSIVTFHRVLPESFRSQYPFPGLAVTPEELDCFLTYFTKHFDCGALDAQHERYLRGEISNLPLLAITFDDAQHDNYQYARAVLARHNVKASFFAPVVAVERHEVLWHDRLGFALLALLKLGDTGRKNLVDLLGAAGLTPGNGRNIVNHVAEGLKGLSLDRRMQLLEEIEKAANYPVPPEFARIMTFDEIAALSQDGHEIGSHSMTHCLMPQCDDVSLAYEVGESRKVLSSHVENQITTFCYPNGNSDERSARAVSKAGYQRAVTTTWGCNSQDADQFQLRRYDMVAKHVQDSGGTFLPELLAWRMSGFYPGLGK